MRYRRKLHIPSSLPTSVSCQLLSPTLEKSTLAIRPHRRRRDAAHRATECGPEFDETIDCAALAWRLSYLQSLLPPEADLAMRKHRRRLAIDEGAFIRFPHPPPLVVAVSIVVRDDGSRKSRGPTEV